MISSGLIMPCIILRGLHEHFSYAYLLKHLLSLSIIVAVIDQNYTSSPLYEYLGYVTSICASFINTVPGDSVHHASLINALLGTKTITEVATTVDQYSSKKRRRKRNASSLVYLYHASIFVFVSFEHFVGDLANTEVIILAHRNGKKQEKRNNWYIRLLLFTPYLTPLLFLSFEHLAGLLTKTEAATVADQR